MSNQPDFPVYDADNHLYESMDAFTRHLPEKHRRLIRFVEMDGRKKLVVRDRLTEFIPNPTFDIIARPGSHMDYYAGNNPEGRSLREMTGKPIACPPAFRSPGPRLELLDTQGIHATVVFPTLASLLEERLIDDPELTMVALGAFNEWLYDEWTYNYQDRIFATPVVNPCLGDESIAQLDRILERGAPAVLLRPAPVSGIRATQSPFLAEFDPFWARISEAGILVCLHASDSGYQQYLNTWEGEVGEYVAFKPKAFPAVSDDGRSIQDALASAICHGMLTRFPDVHLMSVENGGSWVAHLRRNLELVYKKMPNEFSEHPLEVFSRNIWINPFWEDSLAGLIDLVGTERVCYGSDYPHPEGMAEPVSWYDEVKDLPDGGAERIMSRNLADLLAA